MFAVNAIVAAKTLRDLSKPKQSPGHKRLGPYCSADSVTDGSASQREGFRAALSDKAGDGPTMVGKGRRTGSGLWGCDGGRS